MFLKLKAQQLTTDKNMYEIRHFMCCEGAHNMSLKGIDFVLEVWTYFMMSLRETPARKEVKL